MRTTANYHLDKGRGLRWHTDTANVILVKHNLQLGRPDLAIALRCNSVQILSHMSVTLCQDSRSCLSLDQPYLG